MLSRVYVVRPRRDLEGTLGRYLDEAKAKALGLAVAYVSVYGANYVQRLSAQKGLSEIRLITDLRDAVTHPHALRIGLSKKWMVRAVDRPQGTFHPKVYVAGDGFGIDGSVNSARLLVVGSSNLSKGGLINNVECSMIHASEQHIERASRLFSDLWELGCDLDEKGVDAYEKRFVERNRRRSPRDMEALGVADEPLKTLQDASLRTIPLTDSAFSPLAAHAVWVGLRTTTGGYRFQVEFPRQAAVVLRGMLERTGQREDVTIVCEDGSTRQMRFAFYENQMFRLNIPNDLPGVDEARSAHSGVVLVEAAADVRGPFRLTIVHEESKIQALEQRSYMLGAWGRTSTRLYGWF